jgi:hypothetical protein
MLSINQAFQVTQTHTLSTEATQTYSKQQSSHAELRFPQITSKLSQIVLIRLWNYNTNTALVGTPNWCAVILVVCTRRTQLNSHHSPLRRPAICYTPSSSRYSIHSGRLRVKSRHNRNKPLVSNICEILTTYTKHLLTYLITNLARSFIECFWD